VKIRGGVGEISIPTVEAEYVAVEHGGSMKNKGKKRKESLLGLPD